MKFYNNILDGEDRIYNLLFQLDMELEQLKTNKKMFLDVVNEANPKLAKEIEDIFKQYDDVLNLNIGYVSKALNTQYNLEKHNITIV